jgi:AraC-like DNA-binding protein
LGGPTGKAADQSGAHDGLFRTVLSGPGATLGQAFARLEEEPWAGHAAIDPVYGIRHAIIRIPGELDGSSWELLSIRDEIFVVITRCDYLLPRQELVPSEPFLELHFTVDGETTLVGDGSGDIAIRRSNMLVCRQGDDSHYTVYCPPGPRLLVSIYVRPEVMIRQFDLATDVIPRSTRQFLENRAGETLMRQLPIYQDVQDAIRVLLATELTGMRRLHFTAAKSIELLCLCARDLVALSASEPANMMFNDRDVRMFDKARQLLATQFAPPPTITTLAKAVGTNTNKLKTGFKLIYGMTIFEFGNYHRMHHAMLLLSTRHIPVSEAARAVGYRSQASFSTAFKDFFGQLPRDVRRANDVERTHRLRSMPD